MAKHVFISYAREDQAYTRELADHLRERGFGVWMDDRIDFGDRWWPTIVQALRACGAFVVVMTPESEESDWVHREVLLALDERKPILPLLLRGGGFRILIDTQYADVTGGRMPPGEFCDRLRQVLAGLGVPEPGPARQPFEPEMVLIPAGEVPMGSGPQRDKDALLAEMKTLIEQLQPPVAARHDTEVVHQLNKLLAQTQHTFQALGSLVKDQDNRTKLQTLQGARESKEAFFSYFDEHRTHFPQNLCDKLENLHRILDRALTDYELSQAYDHTKDSEAFMYMHRGFETITERIPQLRQEIEQEFRQLIATGDRHTDTPGQSPVADAQVEFSYRLISTDCQSDEHSYQLEVTVENQGPQAINNFKLEFTFPDFDSIPKRWEVVGTLATPVSGDTHQTSGSLVEISPRGDSVSVRREGYIICVTFRSQDILFPDEKVALGEILGLGYRINRNVYANLREMPPLRWALYADNMPRKQGEVPISELNVY
jgi:hypothetical protein